MFSWFLSKFNNSTYIVTKKCTIQTNILFPLKLLLDSPEIVVPRQSIAKGHTPIAARESVIRYQMAMKEDDYTYTQTFRYTWRSSLVLHLEIQMENKCNLPMHVRMWIAITLISLLSLDLMRNQYLRDCMLLQVVCGDMECERPASVYLTDRLASLRPWASRHLCRWFPGVGPQQGSFPFQRDPSWGWMEVNIPISYTTYAKHF